MTEEQRQSLEDIRLNKMYEYKNLRKDTKLKHMQNEDLIYVYN
jgi:hypothetical protein